MGTTLVLNPGSSSKKYALYDGERLLLTARFEQVGEGFEQCVEIDGIRQVCEPISAPVFQDSLQYFIQLITKRTLPSVERIGVRIVAPGKLFATHARIDDTYVAALQERAPRAPAHIYGALTEIEALRKHVPGTPVFAISDSAFHTTMPAHARRFSIPEADASRLDLERFGYHGLSVASVSRKLQKRLGRMPEKVIVCHVGSGVSVTALSDGVSVDSTMGYAPGGGLIMSGRAGDLEPSALLAVMEGNDLSPLSANEYLQRRGGLVGFAGVADLRIIMKRYTEHDAQATLAFDAFLYRLTLAIGGYATALGGLDALVFTATALERNPDLRKSIVSRLSFLDISLDAAVNESTVSRDALISPDESPRAVYVLTTDEMGEVARITNSLV